MKDTICIYHKGCADGFGAAYAVWKALGEADVEYFGSSGKPFFSASYYDTPEGRVFSLRSRGEFDVSAIAKRYGGGGHKNASGFRVPLGWEGEVSEAEESLRA